MFYLDNIIGTCEGVGEGGVGTHVPLFRLIKGLFDTDPVPLARAAPASPPLMQEILHRPAQALSTSDP